MDLHVSLSSLSSLCLFVEPKRLEDLRPVSLESLLASGRLRARGDEAVLSGPPVPLKVFGDCRSADVRLDLDLPALSADPHAVGYGYVHQVQMGSELRTVYLLLIPSLLSLPRPRVVAWRRDEMAGETVWLLFHGPTQRPVRSKDLDCLDGGALFLSWPDGNAHTKKSWVVRRPCVPDEDTRGCSARLDVDFSAAPPELLAFAGWDLARLALVDAREAASEPSRLSDAELAGIFVAAGIWAVVVLVVVVVLFVKLKLKKTESTP
jgi:hypothetical protein